MDIPIIFESIINNWPVILLFFTVAILYASVGFGGGSSYLAILALTGIVFTQIRATALLCNIAVVSSNVFFFSQQKKINWKKVLPLILCSIPLILGSRILGHILLLFFFSCRLKAGSQMGVEAIKW